MNSFLYPTCALVALLALLFKLRVLRTDRSPAQIGLSANFFFLASTFIISTPAVWVAISEAAGIVNFSGLLSQSSVILSAASQQWVLLHLSHDPHSARRKAVPRIVALAVVLGAMITLFFISTSLHETPDDFAVNHAQYYPLYLSVYVLGFALNVLDVGIMAWRYAQIAPTLWLRRGLIMIAACIPFASTYSLCRLADIVAGRLGASGQAWEPIAQISVAVAAITQMIGWSVPDLGRQLSRIWLRVQHRAAIRQLSPLHAELTKHTECMILDLGSETDVRTRLYRLIVEIRDAQWVLRTTMHPSVAEHAAKLAAAAGLEGSEFGATVEASQLKVALRAKARGQQLPRLTPSPLTAAPQDLSAELEFQRELARAFSKSPIVQKVLVFTEHGQPSSKEIPK
nr:hypothetical protein OH820_15395 [Streptomyces sp. NBC_00857]